MMKLSLMRTTTGKEDPELPLLFITVTSLRNRQLTAPQIALHTFQVTDTSQHPLFSGDCVSLAFMVEFLQRNHYLKTPIRRKDLLGPGNMRKCTLDLPGPKC
jgi:hypothetical protein